MPALAGWDELRAEERAGLVRFEPHTLTHPILTTVSHDAAEREIVGSKDAVERELGRPAKIFCYPAGYHSQREVEIVRGVRPARGGDLRVRRQPRARSRASSCGAR